MPTVMCCFNRRIESRLIDLSFCYNHEGVYLKLNVFGAYVQRIFYRIFADVHDYCVRLKWGQQIKFKRISP